MPEASRLTALDLAEGLHLAHAAASLHAIGVLPALNTRITAAELAQRFALDAEMLEGALAYLAARTALVVGGEQGYVAGPGYDDAARFMLDLHVRTFAPVSADLAGILRMPDLARKRVNRAAQAAAFADDGGDVALAGILRQLEFTTIVEFGCGSGALLRLLAGTQPRFRGFGVDANPAICRAGRQRIRAEGLGQRLRIVQGDARRPENLALPPEALDAEAIVVRDFLNELCRAKGEAAVSWLRWLRGKFPGRVLVVADYYGQLGSDEMADRQILLHDFVQLVSGQGVPPSNRAGWAALYHAAGCTLAHAIEDRQGSRFIHLVKLEDFAANAPHPIPAG